MAMVQKKIPISVGITAFLASVLLPLSPTTAIAQVLAQTEEEQNQEAKIFLEEQGVLELGDSVIQAEADRLGQQGRQQYQRDQFARALEFWQQKFTIIYRMRGTYKRGTYRTHSLIVNGDNAQRRGRYNSTSREAQEIELRLAEADRLRQQGSQQSQRGRFDLALESFQQELTIRQEEQDRPGEGATLNNLGLVYRSLGKYDQALDYYQKALAILQEEQDRRGEGITLNNLGAVYDHLGKYDQALDYYQKALAIVQEVQDRRGEGAILNNLGAVSRSLGKYDQALGYYQKALAVAQKVQDRLGEGITLNNLGEVYDHLGKYDQALGYYQQTLAIVKEVQDRLGEGITFNNLGEVYRSLGKYEQALDYFQQSLTIAKEVQDRRGEGITLNNLGLVYDHLGKYEQALDYYQQSLAIAKEVQNRPMEGATLTNLGAVYNHLGKYDQALDYYQQSLAIRQEVQDRDGERNTLSKIGYTLFEQSKFAEAENRLSTAIEIGESLRPEELEDSNKISLFETQANTYQKLQETLIAQNKILPALEIAERGRAQAFAQLLAKKLSTSEQERKFTPLTIGEIQSIAQQQKATIVEYSLISPEKLYIWVITPDKKVNFREVNLKLLFPEQDKSLEELVAITRESIFKGGVVANRETRSPTAQLAPKQGDRIRFRDDEPEWEAWEVISVNNETQTLTASLPSGGSGTQIERPITDVVEILGEQSSPNTKYEQLQQLYQVLIEPIADLLPTDPKAKVIFIPHRVLFSVPFPALQDSKRNYLIEKHTIVTAPAIKVLESTHKLGKRETTAKDILLVGNPTMPQNLSQLDGAENEVKEIASFLDTQPLIGDRATKATIIKQMPKAKIIHLATHSLLDELQGIGSSIALAPSPEDDSFLTAEEIIEMKLNAELVVLSACDTGRGRITGDGVVGLSRSLIVAGVPSVIVSLWTIPDAPTAELMTEFYRQLQETGDKAQALRQAMLITMKEDSNPKAWAAFTLIGES